MTHHRCGWGLLACVALVLLHEDAWAESSAVPNTPGATDTEPSADIEPSAVAPVAATEELIAGRGFQKFQYKGVSFSPGGFFDATAVIRSANENADVQSTFGNIPLQGSANSHLQEFRGTARGSRLNLLGEGHYRNTAITGYVEVDFLGSSTSGNELETNSWNARLRQLWSTIELSNGTSFLIGQGWSLLTTHRIGLNARNECYADRRDLQSLVA